jgi:plastocyanin
MKTLLIRTALVAGIVAATLPLGAGAAAGGGCHGAAPSVGRGDTVEMADLCFSATVSYVERGTEVTWINRDATDHNVVGVGGTWGDLEMTLRPGDRVAYRFDADGVYPYSCWIHPGMIGAIVVGDGVGEDLEGVALVPGADEQGGTTAAGAETADASATSGIVDDGAGIRWIAPGAAAVLFAIAIAIAIGVRSRRKAADLADAAR